MGDMLDDIDKAERERPSSMLWRGFGGDSATGAIEKNRSVSSRPSGDKSAKVLTMGGLGAALTLAVLRMYVHTYIHMYIRTYIRSTRP